MTTISDILAKLEADKIDCPVCREVLAPSKEPVKVMTFPIGNGERVALMPVHQRCVGEAQERIRKGIDTVKKRESSGLWLPGPFVGELKKLD